MPTINLSTRDLAHLTTLSELNLLYDPEEPYYRAEGERREWASYRRVHRKLLAAQKEGGDKRTMAAKKKSASKPAAKKKGKK